MNKNVCIILATYNGEKYLKQQLKSLYGQSYKDFQIIVRDDSSSDGTKNILNQYGMIVLESQQNLGAKKSFATLLEYALQNSTSEYFMFCDQDDVWEEDKIEKTLTKMKELEDKYLELPLLVHTDLKVTGESLNILGKSMWSYEHINPNINSLNRLLIQNTVTGCTMMINRRLAQMCLPIPDSCVMHDWWIGLVASEFGKIGCLDEATMSYRQHSSNSIGAKGFSYIDILKKGFSIFLNRNLYIKYLAMNIAQARVFLDMYRNKLDVNTIEMLESFVSIETKSFWKKRKILFKYKLLKQGFMRNIGLFSKI